MTTQELRELDAWIAEHVMGAIVPHPFFKPTEDPRGARDVLKKCAESVNVTVSAYGNYWIVGNNKLGDLVKTDSLELSICLFAKQLFSQTTKKEKT